MTMRNAAYVYLALCCFVAACGKESAPPQVKPPAPQEKPAAPEPAPAAPIPAAPKPDAAKPEPPKPDPAVPEPPAKPATRVTKDAKGHDWASHMGDIAFTFDSSAAAKRSEDGKRAMMLFFTTPT